METAGKVMSIVILAAGTVIWSIWAKRNIEHVVVAIKQ